MATIEAIKTKKNGVRYRASIRIANYPRRSATFDTKAAARTWAARIESDMRHFKYEDDCGSWVYFAEEMIDRYMTDVLPVKSPKLRYLANQKQQLEWWRCRLKGYRLVKVTHFVLSECRDELLARGLSSSTVHAYFAAISHVFSTAVKEWGWLQSNPVSRVRKPQKPRGRVMYLTQEQKASLLNACMACEKKPLYAVVLLAIATGARKGELLTIKREDIDLERACIAIHDTKNHESRKLHLSGAALELVREMMKEPEEEWVARRKSTIRYQPTYLFEHPRTCNPYQIDDVWHRARCAAGIPDFHFHDLRHTFASYMAMNGASLAEIAEALGHKKLEMVKRYAHLSESHTSTVIASMVEKYITVTTGATNER